METEATTDKRFAVEVIYNGVTKPVEVNPEQKMRVTLDHALKIFGISQNPHLFALFTEAGAELNDNSSAEEAGIKPGEKLLLRPSAVRGGARG